MIIKFKPFTFVSEVSEHKPIPTVKKFPEWYKKMPIFSKNDKKFKFLSNGSTNLTIKGCNPFLDSLSSGYFILLENDVMVLIDESKNQSFSWRSGGNDFILRHDELQITKTLAPPGFNPTPFKFSNQWLTKTPPGYSALFVHPLNRTELPFYTLSGIVDTDAYTLPVQFPFFIKSDFEGIIPAGTPIAQIIPIKREPWNSKIEKFEESFVVEKGSKFNSIIYKPYKNLFWKRKEYR
jgi:hypothetical protein